MAETTRTEAELAELDSISRRIDIDTPADRVGDLIVRPVIGVLALLGVVFAITGSARFAPVRRPTTGGPVSDQASARGPRST